MIALLHRLSGLELLGLTAILGLVVVVAPTLIMGQWRKAGEMSRSANLKRDMLARGLSVDEIDRLTAPASVRQGQIDADCRVREAQVAADLKRDLLARGLSVEDVNRLSAEKDEHFRVREAASALAKAIVNMVQDGDLDYDAVEGLLATFLERTATRDDHLGRPNPAQPLGEGAPHDVGPSGKGKRDLQGIPTEPIAAAERPRD